MEPTAHTLLAEWDNFYIIAGSVAGALIGLQFVVIALLADSRKRATHREIAAFGTPTVLHFCAALGLSALLSAPWTSLSGIGVAVAACGIAGVAYVVIVIRRARRQRGYQPELEDWIWHTVLPLIAYVGLAAAGASLPRRPAALLALTAAGTLGLVLIGIHNAWDTIIYIAVDSGPGS